MTETNQHQGYFVNPELRVPSFSPNPLISFHIQRIRENPLWFHTERVPLRERLQPKK